LVASLRPPTMHIRLSDRHAGKAAEAPVVPRPGLFCKVNRTQSDLKPAQSRLKTFSIGSS
jgi:hypothetical protein